MIRYTQGNLVEAQTEALVNTVNEVGVMGKGIALMVREAFPESARIYQQACERGEVRVGRVLVTQNKALFGPLWIIHFPTKRHWRHPSRLEWIREGLKDLARVIREHGIKSVALPPLGCGSGGLEWSQVRWEIEMALAAVQDVDVIVYEPTAAYLNAPKRRGVEELTPARALIAELVRRYSVLGLECTNLEVQKLAWFLQRMVVAKKLDDPLKLRFTANKYGPYADRLRHLLDALDGSYLHCEKRLSEAGPFEPIWFEDAKRATVTEYLDSDAARPYLPALEATSAIIDGFESPLGMELLATVDWLLQERKCEATVPGVKHGLKAWPGGRTASNRKLRLFDDRLLGLALVRLGAAIDRGSVDPRTDGAKAGA
jgi:O-acetyl-ADP-ribose deacetylase (regulator of RNase III)